MTVPFDDKLLTAHGDVARALGEIGDIFPRRVDADPEKVERGLAQALRRMEQGTLTDDEIERLGETFMRLDERMDELKRAFGLEDADLNLNLGPLGNLL